ncbi:oxygenase MpaB family protein [Algoriphagus hitonicola]|uniref:oxygenase MpaB family protein n=1 Tax=Algoriphagus hitonicola TaxID=435880 RepID=UPI0015A571FC|nr:oxygenase MpaB family protein [Algoriphagus hitonicola]
MRNQVDPLADDAVLALVSRSQWAATINLWESIPENFPVEFPPAIKDFFQFYLDLYDKGPEKTLKTGQDFFSREGDIYLGLLGFYSLPYCYAFGDGAEVLVRSERIVNQIGQRLSETGTFVLDIFKPGAFVTDKSPFLTCAKVRLIHAFSRYFINQFAKDWNPDFGKPINQEDLIGTNLAFSFIVLRGLIKLGKPINSDQIEQLLAYWKWIGKLMGVETDYWPNTAKEAFELDKLIRKRHLRKSEAGIRLISALRGYYRSTIPEPLLSRQVDDIFYFFMGKEVSAALNIPLNREIPREILNLIFKFSGWKTYGNSKSHQSIQRMMESQQLEQFGSLMKISLPVIKRS